MKKLFFSAVIFLFALSVFAQDYGTNFTVAAPTSRTQFLVPKNSTLKVKSTHVDYSVLKDMPANTLVSTAIADQTWLYPVGSTASSTATITTLTSTTANITTANVGTTLTLPGSETFTKTTGNANSTTHSGSLQVTDTIRLGSTEYLLQSSINRIKFEGSLQTGTSDTITAGLGEFTTTKATTITGSGAVTGATVGVSGTDTVTAAPVGSLCYRAADSTLYLKIKLTGPKSARWMKVTVGK